MPGGVVGAARNDAPNSRGVFPAPGGLAPIAQFPAPIGAADLAAERLAVSAGCGVSGITRRRMALASADCQPADSI